MASNALQQIPEELQTTRFGLRFVLPATEVSYRDWRIDTVMPFVRIGMVASVLGWLLYFFMVSLLVPHNLSKVWPAASFIVGPPILMTFTITFWDSFRRLVMPFAALSNCAAGSLLAWQIHEVTGFAGAPAVMSAMNIIVMFYAYAIFRLPPRLASLAVAPYLGLTLYFLMGDHRAGELSTAEFNLHIALQFGTVMSGLLVCTVLEVVTRNAYRNYRIIESQQQVLEHSRELIQRYIPPAVAKHIIAGEEAAIDAPQRRRVTVLFSDIVGFTDIADRVEPEVITQVLNEYMAAMADLIEEHGGTLNEFAGDGLMALFGAPVAMNPEEQALRAMHAAQAMQQKMPELNDRWRTLGLGQALKMRIGINTGMLSVGSFGSAGRMTYTAIGLQTNIAARIQSHCEHGGILISDATWQLIRDEVRCEPKGEITIKGVHFPIAVYQPRPAEPEAIGQQAKA